MRGWRAAIFHHAKNRPARIAEFSEFVKRQDSSVLPAMEAIAAVGTSGAATELLGTTKADFSRMRSRLRQLGKCYQTGESVPDGRTREPHVSGLGAAPKLTSPNRTQGSIGIELAS